MRTPNPGPRFLFLPGINGKVFHVYRSNTIPYAARSYGGEYQLLNILHKCFQKGNLQFLGFFFFFLSFFFNCLFIKQTHGHAVSIH